MYRDPICDRCHKEYKMYRGFEVSEKKYANGLMLVEFSNGHYYIRGKDVDLCPDCLDGLISWLGNAVNVSTKLEED